ncbi:K(+)/H(+) antiporter 1 [Fusarium oxysporum f. sp. albedinis]|nr:K(+)/H(+) antiporter 1 [Fusarium oxysporum f. sp. albedinis]
MDSYKISGVFHVGLSRPVIPRSKPQLFPFPFPVQLAGAGGDIPKPTAAAREPRHQIISASNSSEGRYLTEGQLRNTTRSRGN